MDQHKTVGVVANTSYLLEERNAECYAPRFSFKRVAQLYRRHSELIVGCIVCIKIILH